MKQIIETSKYQALVSLSLVTNRTNKEEKVYKHVECRVHAELNARDDKWYAVEGVLRSTTILSISSEKFKSFKLGETIKPNNCIIADLEYTVAGQTEYLDKDEVVCKHTSTGFKLLNARQCSDVDLVDIVIDVPSVEKYLPLFTRYISRNIMTSFDEV